MYIFLLNPSTSLICVQPFYATNISTLWHNCLDSGHYIDSPSKGTDTQSSRPRIHLRSVEKSFGAWDSEGTTE